MQKQFTILQVLNSSKQGDERTLVFKIRWADSKEIAYMKFDVAKKKYPHIVLDYLVSRIKQKPVPSASKNVDNHSKEFVSHETQEPELRNPILPRAKQESKLALFFSKCAFCESKTMSASMFDYDAIVPINSNMAYPVHFKLPVKHRKLTPIRTKATA